MAQALTSGEISAGSFVSVLGDEKEQGAPVDSGLADEVWGARFNTAILDTAPHPNAAQVLANFIVTQPGQEAIAHKAASVLPDIEGAVTTVDKVRVQDLTVLTPEFVADVPGQVERPVQVSPVPSEHRIVRSEVSTCPTSASRD